MSENTMGVCAHLRTQFKTVLEDPCMVALSEAGRPFLTGINVH